ncbi:hypothetical protein LCGC14_0861540 [marine sediment metagenome]|uniref:Holin n=1 Tax=marine sediment metagenome TaxID=412755 RepID=A0A0F9P762_9ZZZZ
MKKWYQSRILWVNIIGAIVIAVESQTSWIVPPEVVAGVLVILNSILRFRTDEGIS